MPAVPLRKRLLRGAFAYARKLQELRQHMLRSRDAYSESDSNEARLNIDKNHDSDTSSVSSVSSLSFISSLSSISSCDENASASDNEELRLPDVDFIMEDEDDELYLTRLAAVQARIHFHDNTRVLAANKVKKLSQLYLVLVDYKTTDSKRFRRNLRVEPDTFDALLKKINWLPIFMSSGPHEQLPVDYQLAIVLFCFGHFGNAASVESVAQWAGCSAGTVVNATRRIIHAFLTFHDDVIHYPSSAEKEAAKEWVEAASCAAWRDGFIFVDGTLVPLSDKPGFHGEAYFDRKSNYSLNVQVSSQRLFLRVHGLFYFILTS